VAHTTGTQGRIRLASLWRPYGQPSECRQRQANLRRKLWAAGNQLDRLIGFRQAIQQTSSGYRARSGKELNGAEAGYPITQIFRPSQKRKDVFDKDYLVLSTIHSAKGQEWKSVFVLNCVDGCIPSDLATKSTPEIEEERRLLYVAMTRAKDHLHLIVPQRFYAHQQRSSGDRHMYALRTRFIPDSITGYFEQCTWPVPVCESSCPAVAPQKTVPIGARLKQMWR